MSITTFQLIIEQAKQVEHTNQAEHANHTEKNTEPVVPAELPYTKESLMAKIEQADKIIRENNRNLIFPMVRNYLTEQLNTQIEQRGRKMKLDFCLNEKFTNREGYMGESFEFREEVEAEIKAMCSELGLNFDRHITSWKTHITISVPNNNSKPTKKN